MSIEACTVCPSDRRRKRQEGKMNKNAICSVEWMDRDSGLFWTADVVSFDPADPSVNAGACAELDSIEMTFGDGVTIDPSEWRGPRGTLSSPLLTERVMDALHDAAVDTIREKRGGHGDMIPDDGA